MERVKVINDLKSQSIPMDFFKQHPKESELLMKMLSRSSHERPSISDILSQLNSEELVTINKLELQALHDKIHQQEEKIKDLELQLEVLRKK